MATSETRSISSASSDATVQRALSDQPEYVADTNSWGCLTSRTEGISSYTFDKAQRTYYISGPRNGEREPVDIVLPGTGGLYCLIEWDGNESARESAVKVIDRSDGGAAIYINRARVEPRQARLLRNGDYISFGTTASKNAEECGNWPSRYQFAFHITLPSSPAKGVYKHYDMLHELGRGSFSTVMKALNKTEGRWYAVKIIPVHHLNLPVGWEKTITDKRPTNPTVQRLLRESMILKDLRHRNICRLRQVFFESQQIFLALELVEGGDLLKYLLQNKKAMTEVQAGHIVHQICDALAYIHTQQIAHRDLKLENILLTADNPPIVKVADFGLAKVIGTYSSLHSWCGTGYCLAPEVLEGHGTQPYTQVVDSWSVGIITFILLSFERQPYVKVATDVGGTAGVTRRVNWQLLERWRFSAGCHEFLRGLLEHDPARRTTMVSAFHNPWLCAQARARMVHPTPEDPLPAAFFEVPIPAASSERRATFRLDGIAPVAPAGTNLASLCIAISDEIARVTLTFRSPKREVDERSDLSLYPLVESGISSDTGLFATSPATTAAADPPESRGMKRRANASGPPPKKPRIGSAGATGDESVDEVPELVLPRRSARLNSPPP